MDPDSGGGPKTPTDPTDPQHCLVGGVAVVVAAQAALGGNLLEEAEVVEAVRREAAVEEGDGSGEAVTEGAQLRLLLVVGGGAEAGSPLLPQPEKVQIDLDKKKENRCDEDLRRAVFVIRIRNLIGI
jgi:hypothetical protein